MRIFNFKKVVTEIYLIIPMSCICIWAFIFLLITQYNPDFYDFVHYDFMIFYGCGKQIFEDPQQLYTKDYGYDIGYFYLPVVACLFAISISLFPYIPAYFILYSINVLAGVLFVREYDGILKLLKLEKKSHRFLFLIIISNGFIILNIFKQNQIKFIVGLILFFILRRELQYNQQKLEKDLKYYLINYGLMTFAVAMGPYFVFFLIMYLFYDIPKKELFKKENMKKYGIIFLMFLTQNFLFFIYPRLILDFLSGFGRHDLYYFYLVEWVNLYKTDITLLSFISTILTLLVALVLTFNKKLQINERYSLFSLCSIFISLFAGRILLILLPLTLLLFIPFIKVNGKAFLRENKKVFIGLFSVLGIYINVNPETVYAMIITVIPLLDSQVLMFIVYLRWLILISILASSIAILYIKEYYFQSEKLI